MKLSRAYFKYTLRLCKASGDRIQSDCLAKKLLSKDTKTFWTEINKINGKNSSPLSFTVDNTSGTKSVCEMWQKHYSNILNCVLVISCQPLSH